MHGPNGFLRTFRGAAGVGTEVTARHEGHTGQLRLVLSNGGTATTRVTITDAYGNEAPRSIVLRPGARVTESVDVRRGNHWYDISVVTSQDRTFLRRLAGHVETGRPSTSDPAIIT